MDTSIRHLDFLLYISYKTTFKKKKIKAISGQIFMKIYFKTRRNSLNFIYLSDSNFCLHGFCFLVN